MSKNKKTLDQVTNITFSKEFFDNLREAVASRDDNFIKTSLEEINPADVSLLLEEFDSEESKYVLDLLDTEISASVINDLEEDTRGRFLKLYSAEEITKFIDYLDSDDAVDIINELPVKLREEVIAGIQNEEKAAHIIELMRYEEDCAGGLMAKELIKANLNWNIVQCIEAIRRQAESVEKIYSVYVVDNEDVLLGRVSLKKIILADDKAKVKDIYDTDIEAVQTYMEAEEVASMMRKYDLEAVPVINGKGKLVGRITIDDIVDVITEMAEEERQLMSGISEDVEEDDSIWVLTRARLPWLIIGLGGGLIGAWFMGFFEKDLIEIPAMAFFIPLIMATGGNVGIQSSSLVVQSIANKSIIEHGHLKRLTKVLVVAMLNGIVLGILVFLFNILLGQPVRLGLIVAIALFAIVLLASIMGTMTPLILDKFGINPALASGPFITTANDLIGLAVYFGIAYFLLSL
ncbi:magnesium transporter [Bacteroidota bacterium]